MTDKRPRVAVIDDDPAFVSIMHDLLGEADGYEVVSNGHWDNSIEFIKSAQPDLIILDLMMGREPTGWAVLDLLQQDAATAYIPVIVCSAAAPSLERCADHAAGGKAPIEAVAKPFDLDHMLATIGRLVGQRSNRESVCAD